MRAHRSDASVEACLPLVRHVARSMVSRLPAQVELSDLTQAGYLGLLDAAAKYDASKGVRFWTYAELRIKGSILDSLRTLDSVPRSVRRRRRELDRVTRRLEAVLHRKPHERELARELGLSLSELRERIAQVQVAESFAEIVEGLDGLEARVCDPQAPDPSELLEHREVLELLARSIGDLPERERLVITLYYYEELTMKEVGEVLGVNESRISQIHAAAVRKLRKGLRRHLKPHETSYARTA